VATVHLAVLSKIPAAYYVLDDLCDKLLLRFERRDRGLAAEKHKIAAWVRENFAEGWGRP